jgi:hypothetical protein
MRDRSLCFRAAVSICRALPQLTELAIQLPNSLSRDDDANLIRCSIRALFPVMGGFYQYEEPSEPGPFRKLIHEHWAQLVKWMFHCVESFGGAVALFPSEEDSDDDVSPFDLLEHLGTAARNFTQTMILLFQPDNPQREALSRVPLCGELCRTLALHSFQDITLTTRTMLSVIGDEDLFDAGKLLSASRVRNAAVLGIMNFTRFAAKNRVYMQQVAGIIMQIRPSLRTYLYREGLIEPLCTACWRYASSTDWEEDEHFGMTMSITFVVIREYIQLDGPTNIPKCGRHLMPIIWKVVHFSGRYQLASELEDSCSSLIDTLSEFSVSYSVLRYLRKDAMLYFENSPKQLFQTTSEKIRIAVNTFLAVVNARNRSRMKFLQEKHAICTNVKVSIFE